MSEFILDAASNEGLPPGNLCGGIWFSHKTQRGDPDGVPIPTPV